jgi:ribosome recycling factor
MTTDQLIKDAKAEFEKAISYLRSEYSKLQTGRASSVLVEDVPVDAYGSTQPIKSLAQITIPEPRSIMIKPWDKGLLGEIEKAILGQNLGLNPNNSGESLIINLPVLTEERRRDLVKLVHKFAEDAKISIRQARQHAHQKFKSMESNDEITEDDKITAEKRLQDAVDAANSDVEAASKKKEEEVMKV